jgi:septal ring factor EnvC (AmiA/AmiB activator)
MQGYAIFILLTFLIGFSYSASVAQIVKSTDAVHPTPLDSVRKEVKEIQRKLSNATSEIEAITKTERKILTQLDETQRLLNQTRKEMAATKGDLKEIITEIETRQVSLRKLEKRILDRETYLSKRLTALYKFSWLGQLSILATADSRIDFFRRKSSLEFILEYDKQELNQLLQEKETQNQMLVQLNDKQIEKKTIETKLTEQKEALSTQLAKRTEFLNQIQTRKNLQLAAIYELKQAAEKLEQTISTQTKNPNVLAAKTPQKGKDFSKSKGLLNLPVKGKIIYFYGRYKNKRFNVVNFRTGITVQADRGEPIRSVGSGTAIFADWFRGYGNMIIIDHGNHYYTIYAHLEEIFKSKGDQVEADEVIATVGDTGSMGGAGLHFEVRHHGKPLDPVEWIRKG